MVKMKKDLIVISGAPGSGKTVVSNLLKEKLNSPPMIDLGHIRQFHLDREWKKANKKEEQMSFENLVFIVKNYIKKGYRNVIITDLQDFRVQQIPRIFKKENYVIISLIIESDNELKKRVLTESRDSGFRNVKKALAWNKKLKKIKLLKNEFRINNTSNNPEKTVKEILKILRW